MARMKPRSIAFFVSVVPVVGLVFAGALVRADAPGRLTLDWRAPEGCPTGADVRAEVDRLLGGPVRLASGASLAATALVTHDDVWRVSLATVSGESTRKRAIEADSCRGLADATALILALMIDPDAVAVRGAPAPSTSSSTVPSPSVLPAPSPAVVSSPPVPAAEKSTPLVRGPNAVRFGVGPLVSTELGLLPAANVSIGGSVSVLSGPLKIGLAGRFGLSEPETRVQFGTPPPSPATVGGPGGRFRLVSGSLLLCDTLARGAFDFGMCGSFDVGRVRAEGIDVERVEVRDGLWVALSAGGFASWNVGPRLAIPLELGLVVPLSRYRFVLDNVGEVFPPPALGGRATIGAELRF
jgi:hypothetical protein